MPRNVYRLVRALNIKQYRQTVDSHRPLCMRPSVIMLEGWWQLKQLISS